MTDDKYPNQDYAEGVAAAYNANQRIGHRDAASTGARVVAEVPAEAGPVPVRVDPDPADTVPTECATPGHVHVHADSIHPDNGCVAAQAAAEVTPDPGVTSAAA